MAARKKLQQLREDFPLQKRVQQWKATAGPPKEVMFPQEHQPGEMGLSDFTHFKQATITIGGKPFVGTTQKRIATIDREEDIQRLYPKGISVG